MKLDLCGQLGVRCEEGITSVGSYVLAFIHSADVYMPKQLCLHIVINNEHVV